ncbi:hypothetical protein ATK30_4007 [Amycolatopsis echigonensis]|uniref:Uncharacterized protein n=1 Tax=Amycolatopsis echigonensis TaxID=2576905 RepID=A0A2N3WH29_9PSEU|nr:hypothetical protein ATK30_4007 [Amycolatopsis niigatensis]
MGEPGVAVAAEPQPRPDVVGAIVLNAQGRAFVQFRSARTLIRDVVAAALSVHNGLTEETPG